MIKKKPLAIYIHIPFCAKKCAYCDFPSSVEDNQVQGYYIRQLLKEIKSYEALGNLYEVKSVFFGGGTPSLIDPMQIMRILLQLRDQFIFAEDAEITVECNPGTLTEDKLTAYRELGVNRLSMGLQSADNAELARLGRIHTWEQFLENFQLARRSGFRNINIDLMSGLPGQTLESWERTLGKVTELFPEHISAYSLILEEGTPFYERYSTPEGEKELPDELTEREMYHLTKTFLEAHGFHRYEISNYARLSNECRHNITYWTGGDYLGFGLSAASYLDGRRFQNPVDRREYYRHIPEGYADFRNSPAQSSKEAIEEFMFLGLRMMSGISVDEFTWRFGRDFYELYGSQVDEMIRKELMEEKEGRLYLTDLGIDVSNSVLVNFLLDE